MPIYEYQCQACQHELEVLQKISDEPLVECPQCHKPELKKKVSAAAFRLKGGGWYETDFKTGSKKNLHGSSESGGSSDASSSKESKPADSSASGSKSPDKSPDSKKSA
jgi:putative FmdB family regulatory protein